MLAVIKVCDKRHGVSISFYFADIWDDNLLSSAMKTGLVFMEDEEKVCTFYVFSFKFHIAYMQYVLFYSNLISREIFPRN